MDSNLNPTRYMLRFQTLASPSCISLLRLLSGSWVVMVRWAWRRSRGGGA